MSGSMDDRPEPSRAVLDWWRAMTAADFEALAEATLDDYVSAGGPGGRTVGRAALLAEA